MKYKHYIILLLLFFTVAAVYSHPHIFFECSFNFHCTESGLEGLDVQWVFDEVFSASILAEFDKNKSGKFEPAEIRDIEMNAFSNLKNFGYFMHIWVSGVERKTTAVKYFSADIKDHRLIYRFYVPVSVSATDEKTRIEVGSYDDTFFCAAGMTEKTPVRFSNMNAVHCTWEIVKSEHNAYWGGTVIPRIVLLILSKK